MLLGSHAGPHLLLLLLHGMFTQLSPFSLSSPPPRFLLTSSSPPPDPLYLFSTSVSLLIDCRNYENVFTWASAMAVEQKGKGTNIMLGPDISIFSFTFTISVVMDYV